MRLKKPPFYFVVSCLCLFLVLGLAPAFKPILQNTLRFPLSILTAVRQELAGLIFYHRNYVQNQELKDEIALLKQKINVLTEASIENRRLTRLLSLKEKSQFRVIPAQVIGRSADSWSSSIVINKGTNSAIKRGMAVITYLGLAGRVTEAAKSSAKITLVSDPSLSISAIVQRSRQEGVVCGTLGANLIMRYLPEDSDIRIGDAVVTSGLSKAFPKGILIGRVTDIGREYSGLSRYALIRPALNLSGIEEVLVIIQ